MSRQLQHRPRVLIVSDDYWPNYDGGALFERRLALGLNTAFDVRVWAPSVDGEPEIEIDGACKILRFPSRILRSNPRYRVARLCGRFAWRDFREWRPDVVHVHNAGWLGLTALLYAKITRTAIMGTNHMTIEQVQVHLGAGPGPRAAAGFLRAYLGAFLSLCDLVTAPTHHARDYAQRLRGRGSPISVISNGVDTKYFCPTTDYDPGQEQDNGLRVIYVGRLDSDKNLLQLLREVAQASSTRSIRLTVVGEGPASAALCAEGRLLAQQAGQGLEFRLTGAVSEAVKLALLREADVFCLTSQHELQCIAALEALACGVPVLAPAAGALPELLTTSGAGWLYSSRRAGALGDAIGGLTRRDIARRGTRGRAFACLHHDNAVTVQAYTRALHSIMALKARQ